MRNPAVATSLVAIAAVGLLAVPAVAQPVNDAFVDAVPVTTVPSFDSVDVTDATVEPGEPDQDCAPVGNTVWYGLTLADATEVAIDTAGSDYDTVVGVYTGTDVGDLDLVVCNDDVAAAGFSLQARVVFAAEAATTYWVQVAAFEEVFEGGQLEVAFRRGTLDGITCDADVEDADELPIYVVAPGDTVACVAPALDVDEPASWQVEFFDFEQDGPVATVGEADVAAEPDGTLAITFTVPDDIVFGEFVAVVTQGQAGVESYREPVSGLIEGEVVDPVLSCDPDPAIHGDTVECVATQLPPGSEFHWVAEFLDAGRVSEFDGAEDDLDEAMSDVVEGGLLEADKDASAAEVGPLLTHGGDEFVEGTGEADEDGVGRFSFDVPDDEEITTYHALVFTDLGGFALYEGRVEAAPPPVDETPGPKPVPRPVRIDTGAGGVGAASPAPDGWPPVAAVVGLGVLAVLVAIRIRLVDRR